MGNFSFVFVDKCPKMSRSVQPKSRKIFVFEASTGFQPISQHPIGLGMLPEWFPIGFGQKSKNDSDSGVGFSGPLVTCDRASADAKRA